MDGLSVASTGGKSMWWKNLEPGSGMIDPRLLAPDLGQPRKHIREFELGQLFASIAEKGVRDQLYITPLAKAPWVTVAPEHAQLPFVIVSGHRRQEGALRAVLAEVPVCIRLYANEAAYRDDAAVLNAGREPLTAIEQGWEVVRLRSLGKTIKQIAATLVFAEALVYEREYLTRLAPDLQRRLDPEVPVKQRLPVGVGSLLGNLPEPSGDFFQEKLDELGPEVSDTTGLPEGDLEELTGEELRYALQRLYLAVILKRKLLVPQAREFVMDKKRVGTGRPESMRRFQANKRREVLTNYMSTITGSVVLDWSPDEWRRIMANASYEDVDACVKETTQAQGPLPYV
jgi:hypothetical protein